LVRGIHITRTPRGVVSVQRFGFGIVAILCFAVLLLLPAWPAEAGAWRALPELGADFDCRAVDFVDGSQGWVGGYNSTDLPSTMQYYGFIERTDSGGTGWSGSGAWDFNPANDLDFVDGSRGWAVLGDGTILSTTSRGSAWTVQAEGSSDYRDNNWTYASLSMADASHGCAVGSWVGFIGISYPRIVYTQNGSEWKSASLPKLEGGWLESVCMVDAQSGWAVGSAGPVDQTPLILVTQDGGGTWTRQTSGLPANGACFHGVWFVDRQSGWAVGDLGTIYATSDGGATWKSQASGVSKALLDVRFAASSIGWVVGEGGTILETTEAGDSWTPQFSPTTETLRAVASAGGSVWAVGDGGVVLTASESSGTGFSDIDLSPYQTAIRSLASESIINGFTDGTFRPNDLVTRQQFAKMVVCALRLPTTTADLCRFSDVALSAGEDLYPDHFVGVAAANGITLGYADGSFGPYGAIERTHAVTMVIRALERIYPTALEGPAPSLLDGLDFPGVPRDPRVPMPRGEVAQLLYNMVRLLPEVAAFQSSVQQLDEPLKASMLASGSWSAVVPVSLEELRLLGVSFWGFDGKAHTGSIVVDGAWADDLRTVFRKLYESRFPIRGMNLIDDYAASDERSMAADNTSGYNGRYVGGTTVWSMHAYGLAIDINPIENPWVDGEDVSPAAGWSFVERSRNASGMIHSGDVVVRAFASIGWKWGGDWTGSKDYQHFSRNGK
jgi:photosystem II stability/assembly factor-like uncharacterized protein